MNLKYSSACGIKIILIGAMLGFAIGYSMLAQAQFATQEPKSRSFTYFLTGEAWLVVSRFNNAEDSDWNPSYVNAVSTYRPVVVKHGDKWEVTFRNPNLNGGVDLP